MAKIGLKRGDRCRFAKHRRRRQTFGHITPFSGGAVRIYITNVCGRDTGALQRPLDADLHGFPLRLSNMGGVAVGMETGELGVDRCTACQGMFQRLKDQRARPFANYQTIALLIKRCRCGVRRVITLAGGKQGVEHRASDGQSSSAPPATITV